MSLDTEHLPAPIPPAYPGCDSQNSWRFNRILVLSLFILGAQVGFIVFLGEKNPPPVRQVIHAPHIQLANDASRWIALDDPTLFALPHTNDFGANLWLSQPEVTTPSFAYTEPPRFLPLNIDSLGMNLRQFLSTNFLATIRPNLKPEPAIPAPEPLLSAELSTNTTIQIYGELASRRLVEPQPLGLPSLTNSDLLPHTRIQVLVDAAGDIISAVPVPSSGGIAKLGDDDGNNGENHEADARAQELVRQFRFAPSTAPTMFGQINFNWHTVMPPHAATSNP
jgi:hypothetical protein